ncbi:MAG TPA: hypothetical protein VFX49_11775 [Chloroflexota bacterium]|nr:hypothetical protein [Chloroflexota bacterium]
MWWRALLAAIGIVYEILRCYLCERVAYCRKGQAPPPGWQHREGRGWVCPACG